MSRRRNNSDDEEDSCVLVGTPLVDLIPEDAKFSVKPKRPEEQIVTDERGRQRFHGAFTGGFSAGYFNSVGSKEGWAPSTFQSSRKERADNKKSQRPEDFMDEEDFAEHGIAPKSLKIKSDFKDQSIKNESSVQTKKNFTAMFLDDLIKPARNTIGVKMLRKMGWREGTGIGPKIKRKLRKLKTKQNFEPGRKIYGVALPSESDESEEFEDEYLVSTFDVNQFQFEVKEDLFGLGYKRLDVSSFFGNNNQTAEQESPAASLLFPMGNQKKINKKGITGHAFGVGEYEDEDDVDIYQQDSMEKYDFGLDNKKQSREAQKILNKSYGFGAFDDDVSIIKKFNQSKKKQEPAKVFQGPEVPQNFNLMHKFPDGDKTNIVIDSESAKKYDSMNTYLKSVSQRSELLGEEVIKPESIFDLISPSDREYLQKQKLKQQDKEIEVAQKEAITKLVESTRKDDQIEKEKKLKRYSEFKSFILKNYKDPYSFLDTKDLTEWEKEKEKEEFYKMYEQSKKIEEIKKQSTSKFVSVSVLNEQNQEQEVDKSKLEEKAKTEVVEEELTDIERAARQKNYGKLTRVEYEWRPHPVVCKRFNVPNPYPDSKEYGTVTNEIDKRKAPKFSLFNVLTAESRFDKEKSKSLFDEINADLPAKIGPSFAKTVILQQEKDTKASSNGGTSEKPKIEFELKSSGETSNKTSDFMSILNKDKDKQKESQQLREEPIEKTIRDDNVYLQERPEIDLFKAIFDDEEEEEETESQEKYNNEEENEIKSEDESHVMQVSVSVLPSSISNINVKEVIKYTKQDDYNNEDNNEDNNEAVKTETIPESIKFTKILKDLAKKKSHKKKDESSDSDTTSSSSSSSESSDIKHSKKKETDDNDSDIEIVYEEVSISNAKKSSHKKSKSKKKKHKKKSKSHHKKKSSSKDK